MLRGEYLGSRLLRLPAKAICNTEDDWGLLGFVPLRGHRNNVRTFWGCVAVPSL